MPPGAIRAARTLLRTAHLLAFGVLYGAAWWGAPLAGAAAATAASGLALVSLELAVTPVWLVQVRGLATAAKALALLAALRFPAGVVPCLTLAAVIGGISSHMPGRYRYYSVLHGEVRGDTARG